MSQKRNWLEDYAGSQIFQKVWWITLEQQVLEPRQLPKAKKPEPNPVTRGSCAETLPPSADRTTGPKVPLSPHKVAGRKP